MTLLTPFPEPSPDDVSRGLAAVEAYVANRAPAPAPSRVPDPAPVQGETRRVRQLRTQVAEAHLLAELQDDDAPLLLDSPKVRRRRRAVVQAARLHELGQDPAALAYRDAKVRRVTTVMVMAAACVGLAVSAIGVQASVAKALELAEHTLGWWSAFGVEPALSLPLLAAVAVQAYSAMRGRVVDRKSQHGRKLFRTEALLLGLTLVLNCWPALTLDDFDLLLLIVHGLGPVAAVTAVWVLPTLWAVLAVLPMADDPTATPTAARYSVNRAAEDTHRRRLHTLIVDGVLPAQPSATTIRKALGCRTETASLLRDELGETTT